MPVWKNIKQLSGEGEKRRAAAFEAQMLAEITAGKPGPPTDSASRTGIQISVTGNGQTTLYDNLNSVPLPVRQQIMNAWGTAVPPFLPPTGNTPPPLPAPRTRSRRFAHGLNLVLPGAGQFYLGQRVWGSVYALGFLASFVAMLWIFVRGYVKYLSLSTGGDVLDGNNLEQLANAFPVGALIGLAGLAVVIYIASVIHLSISASGTGNSERRDK